MAEDGHEVETLAESNRCRHLPSLLKVVNFALLELEVFAHHALEHVLHVFNDSFKVRCRIVRACDIDVILCPIGDGGVYRGDGHESIGLVGINIGTET
jgi:hypothetical protein